VKIVVAWLIACLLISIVAVFLLAGPGGAGAIFLLLIFLIGLLCACIHCLIAAVKTKNKYHIIGVLIFVGLLLAYLIHSVRDISNYNFTETEIEDGTSNR